MLILLIDMCPIKLPLYKGATPMQLPCLYCGWAHKNTYGNATRDDELSKAGIAINQRLLNATCDDMCGCKWLRKCKPLIVGFSVYAVSLIKLLERFGNFPKVVTMMRSEQRQYCSHH